MRTVLYIFIAVALTSCWASKSYPDSIEEKLELCYELRNESLRFAYGDSIDKPYIINIHSLLENRLLQEEVISGISKQDYLNFFKEANWTGIRAKLDSNLIRDLNLMEDLFALPSSFIQDLGCYEFLVERIHLVEEGDFRFEVYQSLLKEQMSGKLMNCEEIVDLINIIPEREFEKMVYRRLVLKAWECNSNSVRLIIPSGVPPKE